MATLTCDGGELVLQLAPLERLGAFHGDIRVPLAAVERVEISADPWHGAVRGLRAPGTGLPGVIALGTWRRRGSRDFVALRGRRPAVVVTLRDAPFGRLIVSDDDAEALAAQIRAATSGRGA
jgi:hypothetical protein